MPLFDGPAAEARWSDPDGSSSPVATMGFVVTDAGALDLDTHAHRRGQLMLIERGALSCEIEGGLWIVPPGSAIWIPGGVAHGIAASGTLEGYNSYIDPGVADDLPERCCAIAVTPLLRAVVIRSAHLPPSDAPDGAHRRLFGVLLDELASAGVERLHLPMPTDRRLRHLADEMLREPAARGTIAGWAGRLGMSERTFSRRMHAQTGMSFGRWRQRLAVMRAIERLAAGTSIQQVAGDLGYDSVPSFTTMFTREMGAAPRRYMAERHRR